MTCAAVDDVTAWCLLAVVVAIARAKGPSRALITIALSIVFIAAMVLVVRPLLAKLVRYHEQRGEISTGMLAALFVGLLASALATDRIGIHAIIGAFLFGAIMPRRSELISELVGKLEDFTVVFFLPFFAFTGLRTDIGLLGTDPTLWLYCGLVLVVTIAGKWGGSSLAAKALGMPWRDSMAIGILMNTRGLTEPGDGAQPFRVVVPIARATTAMPLVNTALLLAPTDRPTQIVLVRNVRGDESTFRAGPRQVESRMAKAAQTLQPLVQLVEGAGHEAVPVVVPSNSPSDAVLGTIKERRPDLVVLSYQRPL